MKKHIKLLALIAIALIALCVFAACNTPPPETQDPGTEDPGTENPGTEDPGTEDPGTEDPGTEESDTNDTTGGNAGDDELFQIDPGPNENGNYVVRFLAYAAGSDYENPTYVLFGVVEVEPGERARPNGRPDDIRGWKWEKWDRELSDVNESMVVCAQYVPLEKHYISFYDHEGNPIEGKTEIMRFDGERFDIADVPTVGKVKDKYFVGWALVDSPEAAATAEAVTDSYTGKGGVKANMILKAYYAPTTAVAPYVKDKITVDGYMEDAYKKYSKNGDDSYINVFSLFVDNTGEYKTDGGTGDDKSSNKATSFWWDGVEATYKWPDTEADAYVIWDGDWIYFMVEVTDNTLGTRSPAYIINTPNAYQNDAVDLWYNFEQNFTSNTSQMKVGADAFGLRKAGEGKARDEMNLSLRTMSWWYEYIQVAASVMMEDGTWTSVRYDESNRLVDKNGQVLTLDANGQPEGIGNKFRVEFAIPALTEPTAGNPEFGNKTLDEVIEDRIVSGYAELEAYDVIRVCLQSNDVKGWTKEDASGNPIADARFYTKNFSAGGRTQHYYPVYDTISLAGDGDYNAE